MGVMSDNTHVRRNSIRVNRRSGEFVHIYILLTLHLSLAYRHSAEFHQCLSVGYIYHG